MYEKINSGKNSRARTCEIGVCTSYDTGVIPLETQMHSCFSKYPRRKAPLCHQSLTLNFNLSLLFFLYHSLYITGYAYQECRICMILLRSLSKTHRECLAYKLAIISLQYYTRGNNGLAEKVSYKLCTLLKMSSLTFGCY